MADTGWLYPATAAHVAGANTDWTNASNAAGGASAFNDSTVASCSLGAGGVSDGLDLVWNLAGTLPDNVVVMGVTLELRRRTNGVGEITDSTVRFRFGGANVGSSLGAAGDLGGVWGAALETETWGGAQNRLGLVQASGHFSGSLTLRIVVEELGVDAAVAEVDGARLKLHYAMTPFYADASEASDGDGSESTPFNSLTTLGTALELAQANGVDPHGYAAGVFEGSLSLTSVEDGVVEPMPGAPTIAVKILPCPLPSENPWLYSTDSPPQTSIVPIFWAATCARALPTSGWTSAGSGRYTRTLAATPLWVCEDWLLSAQTPKGYLTARANTTQVEDNDSSWFHTGSTLSISASDGTSPATNGKAYSYGAAGVSSGSTTSNILLTTCTRVTIRGFGALQNTGPVPKGADTTQPWGVQANACVDCVFEQFGIFDPGFHGAGTGGANSGVAYRNGIIAGCRSGSDGYSGIVFYASSGPVSGRGTNLYVDLYSLLTPAGAPVTVDLGAAAIQTHANGVTSTVTDVEYRQVTARLRPYATYKTFGRIMDVSESFAEPTDADDWQDYPARVVDSDFLGFMPHFMGSLSDTNPLRLVFKRCRLDFAQLAQAVTGSPIGWTLMTPDSAVLIEDCLIYANASAVGSTRHMIYVRGSGIELSLYGNTICGVVPTGGFPALVNTNEATAIVRAEGNVMGWIGTGGYLTLCDAGAGRTVGSIGSSEDDRYSDNIIFGIVTNGYSQDGSYNSAAEFAAAAPSNLLAVVTGLTAANMAIGNARLNSATRARRKKLARRIGDTAYNGVRYAGQYGAWQESSGAARTRSRRAVVR